MRPAQGARRLAWAIALAAAAAAVLTAQGGARGRASLAGAPPDSVALERTVRWLADPAREGRGVGTAGIDSAAAFIERRMRAMGLRPGGDDGTYRQPFEVTTGVAVDEPCGIQAGGGRWGPGDAFQPLGFSTNGTLRAPVVFVGYGITAPGLDWDDYAGLDVRDRLVLVLTNEPGEMDSTSRFDGTINTPFAELRTKAINAREHGALGMIVVNGPIHHAGEPPRPPRGAGTGYMSSGLLACQVGDTVASALFAGSGTPLLAAQQAIERDVHPRSFALAESATVTVTLHRTRASTANVVGWIRGADSTRTLVIGAHYDHLGYGGENALDRQHVPHPGADDNASGTAAMLQVATALTRRTARGWIPRHDLVFVAFTGEESGVLGSAHYFDHPTWPLPSIEAMVNMDMVGRLRNGRLMVMGAGTAEGFPALLENVNRAWGFELKTSSDGYGPSDNSSFYKKQVPVLMLFTGAHADYHTPADTWDKLDYAGLARVAGFATALAESLDARPRPVWRRAEADTSIGRISGGGGHGAWLGTIPDFGQTEGGVLLSGVRENSPAESAGIRQGDVVVKFDDVHIDNLYDYAYALRSRRPGQTVRITIRRGTQELEFLVTLGRRP
jgi:Peptidase family M28/PDZ domain